MDSALSAYIGWTLLIMLATSHAADRAQLPKSLLRACLAVLALVAVISYVTGAESAAKALVETVKKSPKGSFTSPKGIIALCHSLQTIAEGQLLQMTVILLMVYLVLQTFCIPGTIALNAVLGSLLGVPIALPLCIAAGTAGALCCYGLSAQVGSSLVEAVDKRLAGGKGVQRLRTQVNRFRADLFSYLLFLRLTPILPNWLINLASPVVHVPLRLFALATCLGIAPQTYLAVRFGTLIHAESLKSVVSVWDTLLIAMIGIAVLVVSRLKKKFGPAAANVTAAHQHHRTGSAHTSTATGNSQGSFVSSSGKTVTL